MNLLERVNEWLESLTEYEVWQLALLFTLIASIFVWMFIRSTERTYDKQMPVTHSTTDHAYVSQCTGPRITACTTNMVV